MQPETAFPPGTRQALTETDPPLLYPDYVGTRLRAPKDPLVLLPSSLSELTGPVYGDGCSARRTPTSRVSTRASRSASGSS